MRYAFTLSGVIALRMLGLFLILPVFMVLAAGMHGFSPLSAGLAVGVYGLTQAVLQQPFGWLSDRWGRRPVMLLGLALFAAGGVVAALADSMAVLIAGRALQGCGAVAGVAMAFAADLGRPERRPVMMAVIGIGIGSAFLLSMVLSVPLANLLGLQGLFWLTVAFAAIGMALILTIPADAPHAVEAGSAIVADFDGKPVWLLSLSVMLLHSVMTLLFVALPPMLVDSLGFSLSGHWKIYAPAMIASLFVALPLLRKAGAALSEQRLLPWAFGAMALALFLMPSSAALWAMIGVLAMYFLGFNLLESAMPALLARLTGRKGRGRRMGLYTTLQFLGAFVGGVAGGWLVGSHGSGPALAVAGVACLCWGLGLKLVSRRYFLTGEEA
jgi:MFS family permease